MLPRNKSGVQFLLRLSRNWARRHDLRQSGCWGVEVQACINWNTKENSTEQQRYPFVLDNDLEKDQDIDVISGWINISPVNPTIPIVFSRQHCRLSRWNMIDRDEKYTDHQRASDTCRSKIRITTMILIQGALSTGQCLVSTALVKSIEQVLQKLPFCSVSLQ